MATATSGTAVSGLAAGGGIVTAPTFEPITLASLKLHLRLDSGSFSDNINEPQSIPPGSHAITTTYDHYGTGVDVLGKTAVVYLQSGTNLATGTVNVKIQEADTNTETLTLDVAPATDWAADDIITGQTSKTTCVCVAKVSALVYTVKNRSGVFTLGEIIGVTGTAVKLADQGAANPIFSGSVYTDWTGGAFTQVTTSNDNATQEIAYTGTKQYVRTVAKVLLAACEFGTTVVCLTATSIEDDLLNSIITAAREHIEDITRRQIITATWDYFLDNFPDTNYIKLPYGNLQSVSYIKYTDSDGTQTTMTVTTDYLVEQNGEYYGRIVLPYGESWPSFTAYPTQPIVIRYVAGWTTRALVPYKIKAAMLLICANLYVNREGQVLSNMDYRENKAVMGLLSSARLWSEF